MVGVSNGDTIRVPDEAGMVTIPFEEYGELVEAMLMLGCLEEMGVSEWSGYRDAVDMMANDYSMEYSDE